MLATPLRSTARFLIPLALALGARELPAQTAFDPFEGFVSPIYSDPASWLCGQGVEGDRCTTANLDTTAVARDGSLQVMPFRVAESPKFDCFYIYPTVFNGTGNQPDTPAERDNATRALLAQAARFSSICQVFAPFYRQAGLSAEQRDPAGPAGTPGAIAFADVQEAFKHFVANFAGDRDFVLIGHSQGSRMLDNLIRVEIDPRPELQQRMISAVLIGDGSFTVPSGEVIGGSFRNVPVCTRPDQTSCAVAFASFAEGTPPVNSGLGGTPALAARGFERPCSNPAAPDSRQREPLRLGTFRSAVAGVEGVTTPLVSFRDLFNGQCVRDAQGVQFFQVGLEPGASGPGAELFARLAAGNASSGLHTNDYAFSGIELIERVSAQARSRGLDVPSPFGAQ